jgi:hypothetical protein
MESANQKAASLLTKMQWSEESRFIANEKAMK